MDQGSAATRWREQDETCGTAQRCLSSRIESIWRELCSSGPQDAYPHEFSRAAQEIVEKAPQLPEDIEWHFIGHLQSNKAKKLLGPSHWMTGLC